MHDYLYRVSGPSSVVWLRKGRPCVQGNNPTINSKNSRVSVGQGPFLQVAWVHLSTVTWILLWLSSLFHRFVGMQFMTLVQKGFLSSQEFIDPFAVSGFPRPCSGTCLALVSISPEFRWSRLSRNSLGMKITKLGAISLTIDRGHQSHILVWRSYPTY